MPHPSDPLSSLYQDTIPFLMLTGSATNPQTMILQRFPWLLACVTDVTKMLCTRRSLQLHRPVTNLASYQKGVYYASGNIFSNSPKCTADLVKDRKHVQSFRSPVTEQSFYPTDGFLD
jgi:hypothetical protein